MEAVKSAVASSAATASTASSLQALLSSKPGLATPEQQSNDATKKTKVSTTTKASAILAKSRRPGPDVNAGRKVKVHEDQVPILSPKAKYALATDVINSSLRALTAFAKAKAVSKAGIETSDITSSSQNPSTPASPNGQATTAQRALQARSRNATATPPSPEKPGKPQGAHPGVKGLSPSQSDSAIAIAECARLCFSFLRSIDMQKLGMKEPPKFQLENGMLALVTRLIALGLESQATRELCAVKRRLKAICTPSKSTKPGSLTDKSATAEKENTKIALASLLEIDCDLSLNADVYSLAISYQALALRLIAQKSKPTAVTEAVPYLRLDRPSAPTNIIMQYSKSTGEHEKTISHLQALSRTLLSLGPSNSSSADASALDNARNASPLTIFELRCIALQTQAQMWKLAGHQLDWDREVAQPLYSYLSTAMRRTVSGGSDVQLYELASNIHKNLTTLLGGESKSQAGAASVETKRVLSLLAQKVSKHKDAATWAERTQEGCESLDEGNARRVAATIRKISTSLCTSDKPSETSADLQSLARILQAGLSGTSHDYEAVISELANLCNNLPTTSVKDVDKHSYHDFYTAASSFTSKFSRTYPDRLIREALAIVDCAVSSAKSSESMSSWITKDACLLYVRSGVLREIAACASSTSMATAWSSTKSSLTFSRALKALTLKAANLASENHSPCAFDDESLDLDQRGALLEWQLKCVLDVAHRSKLAVAVRKLLADLLKHLATVYYSSILPLRRMRVATVALRAHEEFPNLLPSHVLQPFMKEWADEVTNFANDEKLSTFAPDILAMAGVVRAFHDGSPTFGELEPSLRLWQSILRAHEGAVSIEAIIESPSQLMLQLTAIEEYFAALGDDVARVSIAMTMVQLARVGDLSERQQMIASVKLAKAYCSQLMVEKAMQVLQAAKQFLRTTSGDASFDLAVLQYHLCSAEAYLLADKINDCATALTEAKAARELLEQQKLNSSESKLFRLLHGQAWLIQSEYIFAAETQPSAAIRAGKQSVKTLNSIWAALDKHSDKKITPEPNEDDVESVAAKVRKLNLGSAKETTAEELLAKDHGAARWFLIPVLCRALSHLSEVYKYHGIFLEAKYYSEQALKIAEAIGRGQVLGRMRFRHAELLAVAGEVEAAELLLSANSAEWPSPSLISVEQLRARAMIAAKDECLDDAIAYLQEADQQVLSLLQANVETSTTVPAKIGTASKTGKPTARPASARAIQPKASRATSKAVVKSVRKEASDASADLVRYGLQRLHINLAIQKMRFQLMDGNDISDELEQILGVPQRGLAKSDYRLIQSYASFLTASASLASDFSFSVLPESTLSLPAICAPEPEEAIEVPVKASRSTARKAAGKVAPKKAPQKSAPAERNENEGMLSTWINFNNGSALPSSTASTHVELSVLSSISMLLSVTSTTKSLDLLNSERAGYAVEFARNHASQAYAHVAASDRDTKQPLEMLTWPEMSSEPSLDIVAAAEFQDQYVNILPEPWTAISLGLNDACDELYLTRYRKLQPPLILRLPFARHKPDNEDGEPFDFHTGRAELKDIIELSNRSCHNAGDTNAKGAKTKWWTEREALDRRLQELLINIESLWFGGFKGIFASQRSRAEELGRFRKAFETVLDRHLPSRRAQKRSATNLSVDDQVLELFIGLGTDEEQDLDEALSDLLYFVVDMLQFRGERNAYDEVDFDTMVVEVLDALRAYHDSTTVEANPDAHLILVLDRRLHALPWENLPFLEGASVSRVDSMLTLRDRILEMRAQQCVKSGFHDDHHIVSRRSGCYVLNPSRDLKATEATLGPMLGKLPQSTGNSWSSIVGRSPSEEELVSALSESAMTLYFGHGAGSQYIRPRAVRRLDTCSEVVWLMGCSSGAVTEYDELEPFVVPLAYLVAGQSPGQDAASQPSQRHKCMAVVATLWDVTDKDIDRFSLAVGEEWGLWDCPSELTALPAKTPRKRDVMVMATSTPQRAPKTPKTPRVRPTPAPRTPAPAGPARDRSRARRAGGEARSLVEAVARSREACYLRYLNGAAPVVYGVPVYLGD